MWSVCVPKPSDHGADRRELVSLPHLDVDATVGAGDVTQCAYRPPIVADAVRWWWVVTWHGRR
jgi:hypothetical protein